MHNFLYWLRKRIHLEFVIRIFEFTKENLNFAIISNIVSHGTFGLWAAFLASMENTHVMADDKLGKNNQSIKIEEVQVVKKAGLKNFIFMDDL